ncbi:MAG TPA: DUF5819 family protein [Bacteroidia bacterium]|jgi:hypothetical protein|nr:DUF5819 family protein [Bacteroidia bacterium]
MKRTLQAACLCITLLFIFHFAVVITSLLSGLYPGSTLHQATGKYMTPFFEQDWSMFSVPGGSNKAILFKYKMHSKSSGETYETDWLDITAPLQESNSSHYFSLSQRLLKYTSCCINSIYNVANQAIATLHKDSILDSNDSLAACFVSRELKDKSLGFQSLRLYASQLIETLPIPRRTSFDSVVFATRIIDDAFPSYPNRSKDFFNPDNHTYTEFRIDYAQLY